VDKKVLHLMESLSGVFRPVSVPEVDGSNPSLCFAEENPQLNMLPDKGHSVPISEEHVNRQRYYVIKERVFNRSTKVVFLISLNSD
jgi:hypothetical protein